MRIGIFPNLVKKESTHVVRKLIGLCEHHNLPYFLPAYVAQSTQDFYHHIDAAHLRPRMTLFDNIDIAMVLGGDGTILKLANQFADSGIPICGVNLGSLGFLYEVETRNLEQRFHDILDGHYFLEERMMLHSELDYEDGTVQVLPDALNDIVIGHGNVGKLIRVDMSINDHFVQQFPGDGLIVSTPTGSTGYTFSAGGPIVSPEVRCLMVTPICPHLLLKVPLVLHHKDRISLSVANSRNGIRISVDGMMDQEFTKHMMLQIHESDKTLKLVRFNKNYFYKNLFTKMMGND